MSKGLCGSSVCQRLCSKVEHCRAGQDRIWWLWQLRRAERSGPKPRQYSYTTWPKRTGTQAAFTTQNKHPWGDLNQPQRKNQVRVYTPRIERQAAPPYGRSLGVLSIPAVFAAFMLIMLLVFISGLALNGQNITPSYEPDPIKLPAYEWLWEK